MSREPLPMFPIAQMTQHDRLWELCCGPMVSMPLRSAPRSSEADSCSLMSCCWILRRAERT